MLRTRMDARLGPEARRSALRRLADETFDVVVIGGGVTGAGCALDAATRGLGVALLEQRDIGAGTSSRLLPRKGKMSAGSPSTVPQMGE